jgi:hypothetical protein
VDDVGESAFEDAEGFEAAVAGGSASFEHGSGAGVEAGLGSPLSGGGGVEMPVPGPGEPVPGAVGGPDRGNGSPHATERRRGLLIVTLQRAEPLAPTQRSAGC